MTAMTADTVDLATGSCPLCDSPQRNHVWIDEKKELVRCRECRFFYVFPFPTQEELKALYDEEYFSEGELATFLQFRMPVFKQCLNRLNSMGFKGGRILDVGCGTGEFVQVAHSFGWDTCGIEASRRAATFAREGKKLPVFHATLDDTVFRDESFDVITMLDVLEHLLRPRQAIRRVWQLLKPGGVAVVRVPNTLFHLPKARISRMLGLNDPGLCMRFHLNHFTPNTLTRLLSTQRFSVRSIEVGASETTAHAAWVNPRAKGAYVAMAGLLHRMTGINWGNILVAYASKPR